ncbi:YciI family protein [Actinosynnema sp. NPDC050801]|jgi:hypothetical protein|uniref:YciI family protein n=1 Tax=unclassified Actinosynnema TaxID=2637065 RepID=UPI0033E841CA
MKFMLLINELPEVYNGLDDAELQAISAEYIALMSDERVIGGERLQPAETATTLRVSDGERLLTDGPFAGTKEVLGGYYILDVADLDTALDIAAKTPAARLGGVIEVRPLVER